MTCDLFGVLLSQVRLLTFLTLSMLDSVDRAALVHFIACVTFMAMQNQKIDGLYNIPGKSYLGEILLLV